MTAKSWSLPTWQPTAASSSPSAIPLPLFLGSRSCLGQTLNQHDPYCQGQETLVPETEKTYTVVGICQRPSFEEFSAPGYTLITTADPSRPAASQSLFVTLHDAKDAKSYAASLSGSSPYVFNDNVLRFYGLSGDQLFNTMLYAIGAILILLIMIGSVLLIYNGVHHLPR